MIEMVQKTKTQSPRASQRTCEFRRRGPFPNQKELNLQLLSACLSGRNAVAKDALDKGADPDCTDPDGKTMLMIVAMENFYEIGKLLIEAGADIMAKDRAGFTALSYANTFSSKNMRRLLEQETAA